MVNGFDGSYAMCCRIFLYDGGADSRMSLYALVKP